MKSIRQKILSVTYLILFILFFLTLHSCSDDIVSPTDNQIDSARFTWYADTIYNHMLIDAWTADPNVLYIVDYGNDLLKLENHNVIEFSFSNFYPRTITGITNNEIYIGGGKYDNNGLFVPHLKKFDGFTFTDYEINIPNIGDALFKSCAKSSNEIWFGTPKGILKFDGTNFNWFPAPDTIVTIWKIYLDEFKTPSFNYYGDWFPDTTAVYQYIYKYSDNQIVQFFNNTSLWTPFIMLNNFQNGELFGKTTSTIYHFLNKSFTKILNVPSTTAKFRFTLGNSYSDFVSEIGPNLNGKTYLMHWDGQKWSKEFEAPRPGTPYPYPTVLSVNNVYYILWDVEGTVTTNIYKGIKKGVYD
jgi:hypothetical protein